MTGSQRLIKSHTQLDVYRKAFNLAMEIFRLSKSFPIEERYSLTDQMRRSSRSVTANIAEAWRKRKYEAAFIAKLSDSEAEAAETQTWIEYAVQCEYLEKQLGRKLFSEYDLIIGSLVGMQLHADRWAFPKN